MSGAALTIDAARVALLLYVGALLLLIGGRPRSRRVARALWSAGLAAYLVHVLTAFHFVHGWSHRSALAETARQTRALFGIDQGFGLWFNYLFTAVWVADCAWWWWDESGYRHRAARMSIGVHVFIAFMFFNGAVVFAHGPSRWIGVAAGVVLPAVWMWSRRRRVDPAPADD